MICDYLGSANVYWVRVKGVNLLDNVADGILRQCIGRLVVSSYTAVPCLTCRKVQEGRLADWHRGILCLEILITDVVRTTNSISC